MEIATRKQNDLMLKLNYYLTPSLLLAADFIAVCAAIYTAIFLRDCIVFMEGDAIKTGIIFHDAYLYFVLPAVYVSFIAYADLYNRRLRLEQWAENMLKISSYICVMIILVAYFLGMAEPVARLFMALFWLCGFFYLCAFRFLANRCLHKMGIWRRPVIIVGAGKTAEILTRAFERDTELGYKVVGFIEDCQERPLLKKYANLGKFQDVESAIQNSGVQDVILATPGLSRKELVKLFYRTQPHVKNLSIVPDVFGVPLGNMKIEILFHEKALLVNTRNNLNRRLNQWLKRVFDLAFGSLIFIWILPVLLLLAVLIKVESKGRVFHIAERIGKSGKLFYCYKFRTMHTNADEILEKFLKENPGYKEEWERYAKLRGKDPRVTRSGKWLRKYSLDELPQIVNVLMGSMSLVGPRPYLPREREKIGEYINIISLTVPGITGLWQVSGRNEIDFNGRLQLDSWYVRNWSFWQDIVILIKTVKVVLGRDGAY